MPKKALFLTFYPSPIGRLTVVTTGEKLCRLAFPGEEHEGIMSDLKSKLPGTTINVDEGGSTCREIINQLDEYFSGSRFSFTIPMELYGTPFQLTVWSALREIPYGTTLSYGDIAEKIGRPKAARAVGQAVGRNPLSIIIPCHRVIGKNGQLIGFGGGLKIKEWLLNFEAKHVKTRQTSTGK
ncbi:MAG: methylated-DNA--[protein]-cysteine S-methyltransferase [Moorella sp. (in: firmicutes)]